ncbi:MAG TPA: hypothetical protein PLX83_02390, partial [bacterium]|nr:hypothetical protein [bacterium]
SIDILLGSRIGCAPVATDYQSTGDVRMLEHPIFTIGSMGITHKFRMILTIPQVYTMKKRRLESWPDALDSGSEC